jgi:hypothetical protein
MLKKLIMAAGVAGTLGAAAPAFADWYRPAHAPVYSTPVRPGYGYYGNDWRRREEWRRREQWRRSHRWEWERHHRYGYHW